MAEGPGSPAGWTSPQVIMALLSVVGMFAAAMLAFQRDDSAEVREALRDTRVILQNHEGRVSRVEARLEDMVHRERERE